MCPTGTSAHRHSGQNLNLRSAFHVIDGDCDGKISKDDLRKFYAGFSTSSSNEDDVIGAMMQVADSNKDGFVEYDEFEKVLEASRMPASARRERGGGVMEDVFKAMDRDGDGIVGPQDLRVYLEWAGFEARDEDIKAMIRLGCGEGGDEAPGVTFDGLLKILAL